MRSKMKKLILILAFLFINSNITEASNPYYYGRVTFHTFYYSLAPYGEWIEIDNGIYAWRPVTISVGWSPYLIGRWVWTRYGWYWDSFEPFGWAVYHYGRWYYDDYYGWIWIPDYEWAPAWVEWRYTDFYVGWAPLPPYASFSITIGIRFSINWYSPHYYWHFVPVKYFCGYEVHNYVVAPKYKYRIYRDSKYSIDYRFDNGMIVNRGVDRNFVERRGGNVYEARINETTRLRDFTDRKTDERNRVIIYRPDEREIDRNLELKIRKSERQVSLDVNKIQTPRERIEIDRSRENEQINRYENRERNENEVIRKDRILNPEKNSKNEQRDETRRNEFKRENELRIRNDEREMKLLTPEERKSNRNFEFNREPNRRNNEQQIYDQKRIGIERDREKYRNELRSPSQDRQKNEIRKRDLEDNSSRQLERKRER